ncbi:peptidoglycan recognition protein family protein [Streptomyces lasiicapitis]|uniref:peptidoglycan recognition protein family protein n=1 Tax=Streptomyces lasiicapitis TaxID=1923961 RepID=UPI0036BA359C
MSTGRPNWQLTEREWAQRTEVVGGQKLTRPPGETGNEAFGSEPLSTPRIPRFISRTEWRAAEPTQTDTTHFWPEWGGIAIHYEGGGKEMRPQHTPDTAIPHWDDCYFQVRRIQHVHQNPLPLVGGEKYWDISYNYLVCHHGYTFVGRGLGYQPGANGTRWHNERYYAICGLIGSDDPQPPQAMLDEIKAVADWVRAYDRAGANVKGRHVKGHRDFIDTKCPGQLYSYIGKGTFD